MPTFYICDLIQNMDTPVHVYIDGYVASAASVIAVCGEKRFMTKHSSILIHQLKSSSAGKFNEMKDEMMKDDEDEKNEDLDLESVIKELESEIDEAEEKDKKDDMDEQSTSSGIGKGTGVKLASNKDEEDPQGAKLKEGEDKEDDEKNEDIDLDEVLAALSEEEDEDEKKDEVKELKSDLEEHRSVIETLRGKLNEVNLLNAKLLFTNKLFRKYGLNNEQKMKVVEQFDRAGTLREVKLVYSTLGESFGARKNEINESKGSASKPVASTKPEKEVITESSDLRDRFKKLANLI